MTQTKADGTLDEEVVAFVNAGIKSGNIDMMKGIATSVTDLTDEQLKLLLMSGSVEVIKATISALKDGSTIFGDIAKTALTPEMIEMGASIKVVDEEGNILDPFILVKPSCDHNIEEEASADTRFAMDNIVRVAMALNLDKGTFDETSLEQFILEVEKEILNNQNAPKEVVTPYLTSSLDALRALAFVHKNTDNAEIVKVMTNDDANGVNIDGFKLAMINLLNTDEMIQSNPNISAYLMGENQNASIQFAMFKNYLKVLAEGGSTIPNVDYDRLIETFVK